MSHKNKKNKVLLPTGFIAQCLYCLQIDDLQSEIDASTRLLEIEQFHVNSYIFAKYVWTIQADVAYTV